MIWCKLARRQSLWKHVGRHIETYAHATQVSWILCFHLKQIRPNKNSNLNVIGRKLFRTLNIFPSVQKTRTTRCSRTGCHTHRGPVQACESCFSGMQGYFAKWKKQKQASLRSLHLLFRAGLCWESDPWKTEFILLPTTFCQNQTETNIATSPDVIRDRNETMYWSSDVTVVSEWLVVPQAPTSTKSTQRRSQSLGSCS